MLVDETLKTSTPGIYAAGDVIGEPHSRRMRNTGGVSLQMNALGNRKITFDRSGLPHAVFTTPQIASVGLTVERARQEGVEVVTRCTRMDVLARAEMTGDARGMVKIVAEDREPAYPWSAYLFTVCSGDAPGRSPGCPPPHDSAGSG